MILASTKPSLDDFRCPRTGGRLTEADDGRWIGPDGDVYGQIDGLRVLLPPETNGAEKLRDLYDSLSRSDEGPAKAVAYISPSNFRRTVSATARMVGPDIRCQSILDVGCGHGEMSRHLVARNRVIGVDLTPTLLRKAAQHGIECYVADATCLPFRAGLFDHALCVNIVQVVPDPSALIASISRAVRIGGEVLLVAINGESIVRRIYRRILDAGFFRPKGIPYESYPKLPTLSMIREWIQPSGLEIREIGLTFAPTGIFRLTREPSSLERQLGDTLYLRLERAR